MERLFNALPYKLQNIAGVKTETFKKHLYGWLNVVLLSTLDNQIKVDNLVQNRTFTSMILSIDTSGNLFIVILLF